MLYFLFAKKLMLTGPCSLSGRWDLACS